MTPQIAAHVAQQETLKALFEAHPFEVLTHAHLVSAVGENFRSRLPWVKTQLGVIDNVPVFLENGRRGYGSYVYRPNALGRSAEDTWTAQPQRLPLLDGPAGAWQR